MRRVFFALIVLIASATLVSIACGGYPTGPDNGSGNGNVTVRITDSPFSDARAVLVTFTEVSAKLDDNDGKEESVDDQDDREERINLAFAGGATSRTCDLKKLAGPQDVLGTGALPLGHYEQIRLKVSTATIYFDNPSSGPACAPSIPPPPGRSAPLTIPSGIVKLNREFDVKTSTATTIVLDFDGDKSIQENGNGRFMMKPVIRVVSVQ